jgi:hypothetical protein
MTIRSVRNLTTKSSSANPHVLSDVQLQKALGEELLRWTNVRKRKSLGMSGFPQGTFFEQAIEVPNYPADGAADTREHLERTLRDAGAWQPYLYELQKIAGLDISKATPRQRSEAALAAARSQAIFQTS